MAHKIDSSWKKTKLEVLLLLGTKWAPIPSIDTAEESQLFAFSFCQREHVPVLGTTSWAEGRQNDITVKVHVVQSRKY